MEEKLPATTKRSLFTRLLILIRSHPVMSWLIILGGLAAVAVISLASVSVVGYMVYDYTQNEPKFCTTCHDVMIESYETWEKSEHADVNCHACHHLSPEEGINYGIHLVKGLPDTIEPRPEGKIIVASKYCMSCHWEKEKVVQTHSKEEKELTDFVIQAGEKVREFLAKPGPKGPNVASSRYHAIHYFNGQTECLTCHGKKQLHVFTAQAEDCLDCHEDRQEKAHAAKGVELACLNCHTDRTTDLEPDREKCLACHAEDDTVRQELLAAGTIDVKHHQASEEVIAKALKIAAPKNAPMESLACGTCHTPHQEEAKPTTDTCLSCHPSIKDVGQHTLHLNFVGGDCTKCHQPHSWTVTEEQAQEECAKCHEYYEPAQFIQAKKT